MTHRHIGVGFTNARVRLETTGAVTLLIGLPDTGTGAHLTLRQVVAEVLGLAIEEVQIELVNTDVFETDSGVGGSRVTHTGGRAAYSACEKLKEMIARKRRSGSPAPPRDDRAAAAREGAPWRHRTSTTRSRMPRSPLSPRRWLRSPWTRRRAR
jgi:CO/xanthine dehydrogenase Mo-binding subunit